MKIVGIDPGYATSGGTAYGVWDVKSVGEMKTFKLVAAGLVRTISDLDGAQRLFYLANETFNEVGESSGIAVIELPRTYGGRSRKGDTNDIMQLSVLVGMLAMRFSRSGYGVTVVAPASIPKDVTENRVKAALSHAEHDLIVKAAPRSIRHNVYDAVGIGLRKLKER